jgi:hypothetical protein
VSYARASSIRLAPGFPVELDGYVPLAGEWLSDRGSRGLLIMARLTEEARPQTVQDQLDALAAATYEEHREHIDRWFYACSPQMHVRLAEMYVHDERFAEFFDKHGEGLSSYVADAIRANAGMANS